MPTEHAVSFFDNLVAQSPVLGSFVAIIVWQAWLNHRAAQAHADQLEQIATDYADRFKALAENFAGVMEENSRRNFEISKERLESSNRLAAAMSELTTLIKTLKG